MQERHEQGLCPGRPPPRDSVSHHTASHSAEWKTAGLDNGLRLLWEER